MTIDNFVEYGLYWWLTGVCIIFCTHFYAYWVDKTDMIIDFRSLGQLCALGIMGPFSAIYAYHALKEPVEEKPKEGFKITFDGDSK